MNPSSAMIRKAAILVASVDGRTAERILAQMDPEEARTVRRAAAALDVISVEERDAVLHEFSQSTADSLLPPGAAGTSHGEHEGSRSKIDSATAGDRHGARTADQQAAPAGGQEFYSSTPLRLADSELLAEVLAQEQPQTIATVFTRLAVEQAAEILRRLPDAVQAEVVQRLATTDRAAPRVLHDIEHVLEIRLSQPATSERKRSGGVGLSTAARLLDAASYDLRQNLLSSLARRDAALARRLASSPLQPAVDVTA